MTGGWKIATIAVSILALALLGGLIYATFFNRSDADDPDYVTVLGTDYDDLISRVESAERLAKERGERIVDIETTRDSLAGELDLSRAEVGVLQREQDNQRRLTEEARRAIVESYNASVGIRTASDRAYDAITTGLNILERLESGDPASEG